MLFSGFWDRHACITLFFLSLTPRKAKITGFTEGIFRIDKRKEIKLKDKFLSRFCP